MNAQLPADEKALMRAVASNVSECIELCQLALGSDAAHSVDDELPSKLLTRHIISQAEGFVILIGDGQVDPAGPVLRSVMEGALQLMYLGVDDRMQKSRSFLTAYRKQQLANLDRIDPRTTAGSDFSRLCQQDRMLSGLNASIPPEMFDLAREQLNELSEMPWHSAMEHEYGLTQKRLRKARPLWYSMFSGPSDLRKLARHLQCEASYVQLYSQLSERAHGVSSLDIHRQEKHRVEFAKLRNATRCMSLGMIATGFLLQAAYEKCSWGTPPVERSTIEYFHMTRVRRRMPSGEWVPVWKCMIPPQEPSPSE